MIKATIYDKKLTVENCTVSDGVKFETVQFEFPKEWDDFEKTVIFKNEDGTQLNVVLDEYNELCIAPNQCYIPHEVLKAPCFYLSVFGICGDSVATTTLCKVNVLQSGYGEGEEPEEPTPTEYMILFSIGAKKSA